VRRLRLIIEQHYRRWGPWDRKKYNMNEEIFFTNVDLADQGTRGLITAIIKQGQTARQSQVGGSPNLLGEVKA